MVKILPYNAGNIKDAGSIPESGISPGGRYTLRASGPGLTVDPQGLAPLGKGPRNKSAGAARAATPQGGPLPEEDGGGGRAALKEGDAVW